MNEDRKTFSLENLFIMGLIILIAVIAIVLLFDTTGTKTYCTVNSTNPLPTNQNVKLQVSAFGKDVKLMTNTGEIIDAKTYEVEVNANGVYNFAAVAGNKQKACTITVSNIDREKPTGSIKSNTSEKTLRIKLTIDAKDVQGLADKPYSWDGVTWTNNKSKLVTANGTYKAFIKDRASNIATLEYKVTNIGNPDITETLSMNINTTKTITIDDDIKKWVSNNSNVASVDQNGKITAKVKGTATITATATNGDKYIFIVTVVKPDVTKITLNTTSAKIKPGASYTLKISKIEPSNTVCDNVSWSTNNSGVAKVNNGLVVGVADGTATITANCDGIKATAMITVKKAEEPIIPTSTKYSYESSTLKYYVQNKSSYLISYIWMEDPGTQIKKLEANVATYNQILTDTELGSKALKRMTVLEMVNSYGANGRIPSGKAAIAYNASGFYVTGSWDPPTSYYHNRSSSWFVMIEGKNTRNNQNDGHAHYSLMGITKSGDLKYYGSSADANKKAQLANQMLNDKVQNTFSFGPLLVKNGIKNGELGNAKAHRQAICQINSNNYVMVTSVNRMSLEEVAAAMLSAGCQTGFNLDGGGSTQLVIKKTGTTTGTKIACRDGSSGTNCRNIVEGIYFVEK